MDLNKGPNVTFLNGVNENYVKYFFHSKNINEIQFNRKNISAISIDPALQTVFLIHGWLQSYLSPMPQTLKTAYLATTNVNIIIVDWSVTAINGYSVARFSVNRIGTIIGVLLQEMLQMFSLDLNNIGLVGYSLGAHVAGVVGKMFNGSIDHIIGKS